MLALQQISGNLWLGWRAERSFEDSIQACAVNDLWQIVAWLKNAGLPLVARVQWPRSGQ